MKFLRSAAAALFFFVGAAHAQQSGPPAWIAELDLTEAHAARRAHEQLEDLALTVSLNSEQSRSAFADEAQALADVADIRLHALQAVYQLLTEELRARNE